MPTIFYVDAENTQATWLGILPYTTAQDTIHLFVSAAVSARAQKPDAVPATLVVHHCRGGHKNAMDFEITAMLGYLLHKYPTYKHVVISKDLGFDYAVRALPIGDVRRLSPYSFIEKAARCTKPIA